MRLACATGAVVVRLILCFTKLVMGFAGSGCARCDMTLAEEMEAWPKGR